MEPIKVSVIIPAYNAAGTIARNLDALAHQDGIDSYEVIVVDDGSTDNTAQIVQGFPNVKYLRQENQGPAAARNAGAASARGEILAFTDSDCIPHSNWIASLLKASSKSGAAVIAGSYDIANPESILARGIHEEIVFRHKSLMPDYPKSFGSYNFCIKSDVFNAVGGFNASYRRASGEDNDLSYKVVKAGERIFFERTALVKHHHTTEPLKYLKEQFRHGLWRVKMYSDHPQMAGGDGYTFWKDIIEVPWSGVILLGLFLTPFKIITFKSLACLLIAPLLAFEICFGIFLMREFFAGIFFGFIIFFRSFARTLGFSTGILIFFLKNLRKKFK